VPLCRLLYREGEKMQTLAVQKQTAGLTGNALKIIAAISMTVDHVGFMFYPTVFWLRYVGRIALPVFMFMIAEGCQHTRNRLRYYLMVVALAVLCQSVYTLTTGSWFLCVPVSFSMAIPLVYGLQACKRALFGGKPWVAALWGVGLCCAIAGLWKLNKTVDLDYGFWGTMLPVAASLFRQKEDAPLWLRRLDCNLVHVLAMAVAMVPLALDMGQWQWWSFLAVPLLMAYSGKRGKLPMKYFFYIFYPAHLAVLEGIAMLIN